MAWAKMDGQGGGSIGQNIIFQQRDDITTGGESIVDLKIDNSLGETVFVARGSTTLSGTGNRVIKDPFIGFGTWHHYAFVVSDDSLKGYIDCTLFSDTLNTQTGDYHTGVDHVDIGRHSHSNGAQGYMNGRIDDFKIFNCALTQEQVCSQMNQDYSVDTCENDTIYLYDTIYIHDTIYIRDTIAGLNSIPTPFTVSVYPNPADELITIDINGIQSQDVFFNLFDSSGRRVKYGRLNRVLDVSDLDAGNYIVDLYIDEHRLTKRIVIK